MKLCWIQSPLLWKDGAGNLQHFSKHLAKLNPGEVDLVVLPEMFTTGFCMEPESLAEENYSVTLQWLQCEADRLKAAIMGSWITKENGQYFNRLHVAFPHDTHKYYDKRHLFVYAGEDKHYTAGNFLLDFEWKGVNVRPLVCFDLRFPVWSRSTTADLLIYVANWPQSRIFAWDQLLTARAIENQCYVLGVNRTGIDGYNISYNGHSALYQFDGQRLNFSDSEDIMEFYEIKIDELNNFKTRFPFHQSADNFTLNL